MLQSKETPRQLILCHQANRRKCHFTDNHGDTGRLVRMYVYAIGAIWMACRPYQIFFATLLFILTAPIGED